jgi:hypothetical protein
LGLLVAVLVAGGSTAVVLTRGSAREREAAKCGGREAEHEGEAAREREERERESRGRARDDVFAGPAEFEHPCGEVPGLPESFGDLAKANAQVAMRSTAPFTRLRPGAYRAAMRERAALPTTGGAWKPYGNPPLRGDNTDYDTDGGSSRLGLGSLSGRATAFAQGNGAIYAAISFGGVWKTTDQGENWKDVGAGLPTQVVSGIAVTRNRVLALTGDNSFGGGTLSGLGAYYSDDDGKTWKHAAGIPDGLLAFRLAVDPNNADLVYAATGGGLFRSTDGGRTYTNVNLPTGDCAGQPVTVKDCYLANIVTDVVVQGPANAKTPSGKPGAVMAAVGWRAGTKPNANGKPQSPGNGIYVSDTGVPGSFKNMDMAGHSVPTTDPLTQARIGRVALGAASGADQDHRIVYAIVQDAVEFNGGVVGIDANENGTASAAASDYLNGIWVSTNFGQTWRQLEGSTTIDSDPTSGSALAPPTCKTPAVIGYCPGIQAWYNLWVSPDPTRQSATGVPTRLVFGLEELWSNPGPDSPTGLDGNVPVKFGVIGRYFAGDACTLLNATNGLPVCPAAQGGQVPEYTTHPDQHGALWVPDGSGGVTLFAGNDGGVYKQHTDAKGALTNNGWGKPSGSNNDLNTLQPYDAAMAKDGTLYMGLQDNGEAKIDPDGKMYTVFGGDGGFSAVDPDNADVAYEEYVGGDIAVTSNGGGSWKHILPNGLTDGLFITPFEMDDNDANHLILGGRQVFETTKGPDTPESSLSGDPSLEGENWSNVYDLGTQKHPGEASASASDSDPANQASAVDTLTTPDATYSYVGFCGFCDTITQGIPFANGLATNVGGDKPGKAGAPDGWHIAKAAGLPSRLITSVRIDPQDPRTVYVTLGAYERHWAAPGSLGEDTSKVGTGHVFKSTDAGATFTDISGNLPDTPTSWSVIHRGHLVVGTDIGVFESCNTEGGRYSRLGTNLPVTPISTLRLKPGDPNLLVAATYGRSVYTYRFTSDNPSCGKATCATTSASVRAKGGRALRFTAGGPASADVRRVSRRGTKVVKRFRRLVHPTTWAPKHARPGIYVARVRVKGQLHQFAFVRKGKRFRKRPAFAAAESCSFLRSAALNAPAFGRRALAARFRLRRAGVVRVTFTQRGKRLLRRKVNVTDAKYHRVKLRSAKARRGDVKVTLVAVAGGAKKTVRLVARKL